MSFLIVGLDYTEAPSTCFCHLCLHLPAQRSRQLHMPPHKPKLLLSFSLCLYEPATQPQCSGTETSQANEQDRASPYHCTSIMSQHTSTTTYTTALTGVTPSADSSLSLPGILDLQKGLVAVVLDVAMSRFWQCFFFSYVTQRNLQKNAFCRVRNHLHPIGHIKLSARKY